MTVCSNTDVASDFDGVKELEPMKKYHFGGFTVIPLRVPHGDCPNYAYLIVLPDGQTFLFATDIEDFAYEIPGLNSIAIECNFSDDIRIDAMLNGTELRSQSHNHLSLDKCVEVIKRLKSPSLSSVVLLHLSAGLSDAEGFKQRIFNECGVRAEVAEKNTAFILRKEEF